ncbi:MAG TPA: peptidylprolyl isomerase [Candidatus Magasanikbacteria bacterium]|nr:peptidylprolyl isomerase [Candidatus Magasanikbacteria bacterium]
MSEENKNISESAGGSEKTVDALVKEVENLGSVDTKIESVTTKKPSSARMFIYALLGVVVLAILVTLGVGVRQAYALSTNAFSRTIARIVNLTAARVNGVRISYSAYVDDLKAVKTYYASKGAAAQYTDSDYSAQAMQHLMINALVESKAKVFGVKVSKSEIEEAKKQMLAQFKDESELNTELNKTYGMDFDGYIKRIIEPALLQRNLATVFATSTVEEGKEFMKEEVNARHILIVKDDKIKTDAALKYKAEQIIKELKGGADFAKLAEKYSTDSSKDNGGDLGWFGRGQMVPEFEKAAFALEPGKYTETPVKTDYGFHVIKLESKRMVRDFEAYMNETLKNAKINVYIPVKNPFAELQQTTDASETETTTLEK